ncbi:MAG TPA: DUF2189 domain-containing protein, partial [Rhizobiaceae bacterium]|nr:DUF2189 domain-containing protein [Rhizobiaceae bacterium]
MTAESETAIAAPAKRRPHVPQVRPVTSADIREALLAGLSDFARAPAYGLFFGGIFALGGLAILMFVNVMGIPWMVYPVAIGFPLIGPFAAAGLYEVSRRLQTGRPLVFGEVLSFVWRQRTREFAWMAFVVLFAFWVWVYQVRLLLAIFLGFKSFSTLPAFINVVTTTPEGLLFLAVGHVVGAFLALTLFSITVVSVPLLLERNVDFVTAMITSVKAVITSPVPMLGWGVIVTLSVIAGIIPFFLGLVVVLPVLG